VRARCVWPPTGPEIIVQAYISEEFNYVGVFPFGKGGAGPSGGGDDNTKSAEDADYEVVDDK